MPFGFREQQNWHTHTYYTSFIYQNIRTFFPLFRMAFAHLRKYTCNVPLIRRRRGKKRHRQTLSYALLLFSPPKNRFDIYLYSNVCPKNFCPMADGIAHIVTCAILSFSLSTFGLFKRKKKKGTWGSYKQTQWCVSIL